MRRITLTITLAAIGVLLVLSLTGANHGPAPATVAHASSGAGYQLEWLTIDGGGGTSGNSGLTLSGTIGQPDAVASSGGSYVLAGGFWPGAVFAYRVSLPLIRR